MHSHSLPGVVNGEGPIPCDALILGEAPGAEEERQGRPFVGASGKLLDRALEHAGADRSKIYITNAYKLRPPNNRTPTQDELDEQRLILAGEFERVDPRRVLLLGAVALRSVHSSYSVGQIRGTWQHLHNRWYMPTWHPAYTFYSRGESEPQFFDDVRRFFVENPSDGGS